MTEEQRKEYERLSDKKFRDKIPLTHDEEIQLMELKHIKERERKDRQEQLRVTACAKLASAAGLTYDEFAAFCDWMRR